MSQLSPNPSGGFVLVGIGLAALVGWLLLGKKKKAPASAVCWTGVYGVRECEQRPLSTAGADRVYEAASRGNPSDADRSATANILREDGYPQLAAQLEAAA